ncbi:MAG: L,D-transpeptidase family protein [Acidimicrobiia bacterium]
MTLAGALVVGGLAHDGADARTGGPRLAEHSAPTTVEPSTTEPRPTATTTDPALRHELQQPPDAVLPALPAAGLGPGDTGDVVKAFQQRMADVHLDPGDVNGVYNEDTTYAVDTAQRLMRVDVNGRIGPAEAAFLAHFRYPDALHPDAEGDRTEVDVTHQVLTLYENFQVRLVTMMSSGSGVEYCYDSPKSAPTQHLCEIAGTPSGRFTYYEKVNGWQDGDLGTLYNPVYFNGGIAVHGADHVSLTRQSFGCINIPMHIADYFPTLVSIGDAVYVDGGDPAPILSDTPINAPTTTSAPSDETVTTDSPDATTTTTAPDTTTTTSEAPTTTTEAPTTTSEAPTTTTEVPPSTTG